MAKDFTVEEGQEVVRRTIVGGRPRAREKRRIRVPIGLEKVLCRAAGDPAFRTALLDDWRTALDDVGYELQASEATTMASVPTSLLRTMIDRIDVRRHGQGRFMRGVMAATFATLATTAVASCDPEAQPAGITPDYDAIGGDDVVTMEDADPSRGISPDEPDVIYQPELQSDGIRPDVVIIDVGDPQPAGIIPDVLDANDAMILGILPDEVDAPDIEADRGMRPDIIEEPDVMADGGVRPDLVDAEEPQVGGIRPDAE